MILTKQQWEKKVEYFSQKVQRDLEAYAEENGISLARLEEDFSRRWKVRRDYIEVFGRPPQ